MPEESTRPAARQQRWFHGLSPLTLSASTASGLLQHFEPAARQPAAWLCVPVSALAMGRALTHRGRRYATPHLNVIRNVELATAAAAFILALAAATAAHAQTTLFFLLTLLSALYCYVDWSLAAARAKSSTPTTSQLVGSHPILGNVTPEEAAAQGQGPGAALLGVVLRPPRQRGARMAGASVLGGLITSVMFSTSASAWVVTGTATPSSQSRTAPTSASQASSDPINPSADPSSAGPSPSFRPPTYDDICGKGGTQPGDGAPGWARPALHNLWLGKPGAGAILAGCVDKAQQVPMQPSAVYQVGRRDGQVIGVGVSLHYGPSTLYIDDAAIRVLKELQAGTVVTGPNLVIIPTHVRLSPVPGQPGLLLANSPVVRLEGARPLPNPSSNIGVAGS